MAAEFYALVVDHDYAQYGAVSPSLLTERIDACRRVLENWMPLRQIGPGIFTLKTNEKEQAFKTIETLSYYLEGSTCLTFKIVRLAPLDDEFKDWQYKKISNYNKTFVDVFT